MAAPNTPQPTCSVSLPLWVPTHRFPKEVTCARRCSGSHCEASMVALTYEKDLTVKAKVSSSSSRAARRTHVGWVHDKPLRIFAPLPNVKCTGFFLHVCWASPPWT